MEILKHIINHILPLTDEDWQLITPHLNVVTFGEKELLLSPPQTCNFIAFIKSGSVRTYHRNDNLDESNLLLRSANEFITDYESFVCQNPTKLCIESIDAGEAIFLNYQGLYSLYDVSLYWNQFGRLMSEQIFISSKRRTEQMLFQSPKERYLHLIKNNPDFFQNYSLKHISSYLGITPQSLSRIRNQVAMS